MLRKVISRSRTSRLISLVCLMSLCMNIFFLSTSRRFSNNPRQTLGESREKDSVQRQIMTSMIITGSDDDTQSELDISSVTDGRELNISADNQQDYKHLDENNQIECKLCPYYPPSLVGPLADMTMDMTPEAIVSIFPKMMKGRLLPAECIAREKLAIIIPYRNRYPHLHIFLHNIIPFLIRQQADATIFVVEQALPGTFNRGALLNVGFLEAEKIGMFDCFIFHDVDLIPLDDRHLYRCGDNPKHFAVALNKYNFRMPYRDYFGGVAGFSRNQYMEINGCSNVYFGWGGEDDEMRERAIKAGYIITRSPVTIARYDMIKHTRDKGNEVNPVRKRILSSARQRQAIEGLNTIKYKVESVKLQQLYVWITVSLNETEILHNAPPYILQAIMEAPKNMTESEEEYATSKVNQQKPVKKITKGKSSKGKVKIKFISENGNVESVNETGTINLADISNIISNLPDHSII